MKKKPYTTIEKSKYFDRKFYAEKYLVDLPGVDPVDHFLNVGWRKGFDPSSEFSINDYYQRRPDVKKVDINPLLHYEYYGKREGVVIPPKRVRYKTNSLRQLSNNLFTRLYSNKKIRVLVILHLFYFESWNEIKEYLKLCEAFNFSLIVTYNEDKFDSQVLLDIKKFKDDVILKPCANRGFDVGPFIEALRDVDLDNYDIVYKIHSKGIKRPKIYIYGQVFCWRDWFENLFNGLFTPLKVLITAKTLTQQNRYGLVAAKNLIVNDPVHKKHFVQQWAERLGIQVSDHYKFVAGTCFAIRASLLKEIQQLELNLDSFEQTKRGDFSLAHAVERLVCACVANQGYDYLGLTTVKNPHFLISTICKLTDSERLHRDNRFSINDDFFYRVLEGKRLLKYKIVKIKLKNIYRNKDGKKYRLEDCEPYKYLLGEKDQYRDYCVSNLEKTGFRMSEDRFNELTTSLEKGFDKKQIIVIGPDNHIYDGQHRACFLLYKYGPEYEIEALKIWLLTRSSIKKGLIGIKNKLMQKINHFKSW